MNAGRLPDGAFLVVARDKDQTYRITGPDLYQALVELAVQTGFELEV